MSFGDPEVVLDRRDGADPVSEVPTAVGTMNSALYARRTRDHPLRAHEDALNRLYAARDWANIWPLVESLAVLLSDLGDRQAAAVLLGNVETHHVGYLSRSGRRHATLQALYELPEAQRWMAHGAELDPHNLIAYAVNAIQRQPA